jgi:hypothetical protein
MSAPRRLLAPLLGAVSLFASAARAQTPEEPPAASASSPDGPAAPVTAPNADLAPSALPVSCQLGALIHAGAYVYVPCGADGVVRGQLAPDGTLVPEQRLRTPGSAQALFLRGDELWVELSRLEARPLRELTLESAPLANAVQLAAAPPKAAPVTPAAAAPALASEAAILGQDGLAVSVALGGVQVRTGDHVELFTATADGEETSHAVGTVTRVARERAEVEVGLGEIIPAGGRARATRRDTTANLVAPPRVPRLVHVEGRLSPYLPVGNLGLGALADVAVTYAFERPLYVRAELSPVGLILSKQSDAGVLAGHVLAGYDHSYFAVGLGLGLVMGNRSSLYEWGRSGAAPVLSVKQATRLGARDGLHVRVDTVFALAAEQWQFAAVEVNAQIPLGSRTWLTLGGGGGEAGRYTRGSLGLRRLVYGHGGSGSLFVSPSVGVVGVTQLSGTSTDAGPSVGVHLEWRH